MEMKNADRLIRKLKSVENIDLKKIVTNATLMVEGQAKALAPVDTGDLKGSIHPEIIVEGNKVIGRVYTALEYAMYVEFGTGVKGNGTYPYMIKGLTLTYRDSGWSYSLDGGTTFIYTKGQIAQPFMYPALKMSEKRIKIMISDEVKLELKKAVRGGK